MGNDRPHGRLGGLFHPRTAGTPAEVEIPVEDVTPSATEVRLDRFRERCHPKVPTLPGQIPRDVHDSGIVPVTANRPTGIFDPYGRASYETGELCLQCH